MRDGRTRKIASQPREGAPEEILATHRLSLVVLTGASPGDEVLIREERTIVGRGPSVDFTVTDAAMSRQHFAVELAGDEVRVRDLGSTNGIALNGKAVDAAELTHGDRIKAGDHVFQFLAERVEAEPRTYIVPD
ncbi:FHA domain-containing protein [bacterium]|nr:FHA domain-containing protein [bacterium]